MSQPTVNTLQQQVRALANRTRYVQPGIVFPRSDYIYTAVPTSLDYMLDADGETVEDSESEQETPVVFVYRANAYYKQVSRKAFDDTQAPDKPVFIRDISTGLYKAATNILLVSTIPLGVGGVPGGSFFRKVFCVNRGSYFESLDVQNIEGYPYGPQYPFGILIDDADVTVAEQIIYRGGVPLKLPATTITIIADWDWAVLKVTPSSTEYGDTVTVIRMAAGFGGEPPADDKEKGWLLRGIHRFRFSGGVATWDKAGWMPSDLGMMGY
jgi:hypothetical protein